VTSQNAALWEAFRSEEELALAHDWYRQRVARLDLAEWRVAVVLGVCLPNGFSRYKAEHSSGDAFFP